MKPETNKNQKQVRDNLYKVFLSMTGRAYMKVKKPRGGDAWKEGIVHEYWK